MTYYLFVRTELVGIPGQQSLGIWIFKKYNKLQSNCYVTNIDNRFCVRTCQLSVMTSGIYVGLK
jgi:hypothetical protein